MTTALQLVDIIEELILGYPESTYAWRGNVEKVARLWERSLGQLPFEIVDLATRRWMDTNPKLPHVSDIRAMIVDGIAPLPSEGHVWSARHCYFDGQRFDDEPFVHAVYHSIGTPRAVRTMDEYDLRKAVTWTFKELASKERTRRVAHVEELVAGAPPELTMRALIPEGVRRALPREEEETTA